MMNLKNEDMVNIIELDYDKLNYLRKNTMLTPTGFLKLTKEKETAIKLTELYRKYEKHTMIGVDYTGVDQLEYQLRIKAYRKHMYKFWVKFGDGTSLDDFCQKCLYDEMEEDINKINTKFSR